MLQARAREGDEEARRTAGRDRRLASGLAIVAVAHRLRAVRYVRRAMRQPRPARLERRRARRAASPATARAASAAWPIPGTALDEVPPFSGGLITMYARERGRDPRVDPRRPARARAQRPRADEAARARRDRACRPGAASSPTRETDDLVAYVKAVSDFETPAGRERPTEGARGRGAARLLQLPRAAGPRLHAQRARLQGLHPVLGRSGLPGAGRGTTPRSASGSSTAGPRRLQRQPASPASSWSAQPIKMPAYRGHLAAEEVDRLVDYIHWVRAHPY